MAKINTVIGWINTVLKNHDTNEIYLRYGIGEYDACYTLRFNDDGSVVIIESVKDSYLRDIRVIKTTRYDRFSRKCGKDIERILRLMAKKSGEDISPTLCRG